MIKKILTGIICSTFIAAVNCFAYSDVNTNDEYYTQISELSDNGIIDGYEDGTFRPQDPITRAEFAKIFCCALDINDGTGKAFNDVGKDFWAEKYIDALSSAGIINGFQDGSFRPNENILMCDAVKMAVCAKELGDIAEKKGSYPDGYMETAQLYLLTEGITGIEDVYSSITRGQAAALLYNVKNKKYCRLTQRVYGDYYNGYIHYGIYPEAWEGIPNDRNIYDVQPNVYRRKLPSEERITADGINYQTITRSDGDNHEWLGLPEDKPYINNYGFHSYWGCFTSYGENGEIIAYSYDFKTWYDDPPEFEENIWFDECKVGNLPFDETKNKMLMGYRGKSPYITMEVDEIVHADTKYYTAGYITMVAHHVYVSRDGLSWTMLVLPYNTLYATQIYVNADENSFVVSCEVPLNEKEQQYVDEVEKEALSKGMIYDKPVSKTENYMIPFKDIT